MTGAVHVTVEGTTALIRLDRPDKLNALDRAMLDGLGEAADLIERDRDIRAAIIWGEGRAFCAGGDIAAWGALDPIAMWRDWVRVGHGAFDRLARLRVPLIAVLSGHALGGGLELAAAADIRVLEPQAKLGLPETGIGMVPGWSGTQRMVRRFGSPVVRRLSLTGALVQGEEALRLGLADELVAAGGAMARAREIAGQVATRGPIAVAVSKVLINAAEGEESAAGLEGVAGALVSSTEDLKEGVASFLERRAPVFPNR